MKLIKDFEMKTMIPHFSQDDDEEEDDEIAKVTIELCVELEESIGKKALKEQA